MSKIRNIVFDCNESILDLTTMTWTPTGSNKADINDEEGWTLLADGSV